MIRKILDFEWLAGLTMGKNNKTKSLTAASKPGNKWMVETKTGTLCLNLIEIMLQWDDSDSQIISFRNYVSHENTHQ